MPINSNYNEEAIVEAIATALDNFYTNLISNIDKLNIKKVMKRKNPYLFRAKAMNGPHRSLMQSLLPLCPHRRKQYLEMFSLNLLLPLLHKDRKHWQKALTLWWSGTIPFMPSL